jgi:molecular chaperone GrpE (heat shock protein)
MQALTCGPCRSNIEPLEQLVLVTGAIVARKDSKSGLTGHGAPRGTEVLTRQSGETIPKTTSRAAMAGSKPAGKRAASTAARRSTGSADAAPQAPESGIAELLQEIRGLKAVVEQLVTPKPAIDEGLEATVDSLRRLLSELIEQRLESVIGDLADIRREAANAAAKDGSGLIARLDELLESLGAVRFEAEAMDVVDPLIHTVVAERQQGDVPAGVIIETLRPGYRTSRGRVVCKAAVAVSQDD